MKTKKNKKVISLADHCANKAIAALLPLLKISSIPLEIQQKKEEILAVRERIKDLEYLRESVEYIDFLIKLEVEGKLKFAS